MLLYSLFIGPTQKPENLYSVESMFMSAWIPGIFGLLRLINKLEFDSNLGKFGPSSTHQILVEFVKVNERIWTGRLTFGSFCKPYKPEIHTQYDPSSFRKILASFHHSSTTSFTFKIQNTKWMALIIEVAGKSPQKIEQNCPRILCL